jgi:hypothetical protein
MVMKNGDNIILYMIKYEIPNGDKFTNVVFKRYNGFGVGKAWDSKHKQWSSGYYDYSSVRDALSDAMGKLMVTNMGYTYKDNKILSVKKVS